MKFREAVRIEDLHEGLLIIVKKKLSGSYLYERLNISRCGECKQPTLYLMSVKIICTMC